MAVLPWWSDGHSLASPFSFRSLVRSIFALCSFHLDEVVKLQLAMFVRIFVITFGQFGEVSTKTRMHTALNELANVWVCALTFNIFWYGSVYEYCYCYCCYYVVWRTNLFACSLYFRFTFGRFCRVFFPFWQIAVISNVCGDVMMAECTRRGWSKGNRKRWSVGQTCVVIISIFVLFCSIFTPALLPYYVNAQHWNFNYTTAKIHRIQMKTRKLITLLPFHFQPFFTLFMTKEYKRKKNGQNNNKNNTNTKNNETWPWANGKWLITHFFASPFLSVEFLIGKKFIQFPVYSQNQQNRVHFKRISLMYLQIEVDVENL